MVLRFMKMKMMVMMKMIKMIMAMMTTNMIKMMMIHLSPDFQAGLLGSTVPSRSWSPFSLLIILYEDNDY